LQEAPVAPLAYQLSKVLAHYRSTEYVENNHVSYDLIRVLPGYIQGANELYTSADAMRDGATLGSNEGTMRTALGLNSDDARRVTMQVFLDDVAEAHVLALKSDKVKNMDNLLVVGNGGDSEQWKDVCAVIKELYPEAVDKGILKPVLEAEDPVPKVDVSSTEEKLGFKFAGSEAYVKSVVGQYLDFVGA
jgi:nucleoside-diphosphate-sugar epimerase